MTMLDAALGYAARGWPVFPCQPGAKTPATVHGVLDATTDPAQIRAWWTARPDCNLAIATGAPGPDVIDVDVKNGNGYPAFTSLNDAHLVNGTAAYVTTPSGGLHAYYQGSSQRNGSIRGHHIDFRATGGYVLAPPSTVDGSPYQLVGEHGGTEPVDWQAIRAYLDPPPDPDPFRQPDRHQQPAQEGRPGDDWATQTTWPQILQPHGWRKVRDLGNGRACWCRPGKQGPFTSATTRDDGGLYVFTTSTSFEPEVPYTKFGAYTVIEHGGDHSAAAAQLRRDGYGTQPAAITFAQPPQPPDDALGPVEPQPKYQPVDWHRLWEETPEDEQWIVEPLLAEGRSIALYSAPKVGKSLLALEVAAAIASGRAVLSQPAGPPRHVLYVDLENSRRDLKDRLTDLGYKPQDLDGLVYLSFPALPALDSQRGGQDLLELAVTHEVALVVIDTVSRVISGKENDADTFNALYRYALAPLKGRGVAVFRLDHAGKDVAKGQRGTSAKNGDVDAVWILTAAGPVLTLRCEMSRTEIKTQSLSLRRETDPHLHHKITGHAETPVDRVQAMMAKLDELGVPRSAGQPTCRRKLNEAGVPVAQATLAEAVKTRRMQPDLYDDLGYSPAPGTGTADAKNLSAGERIGSGETAGQGYTEGQSIGAYRPVPGTPAEPIRAGSLIKEGSPRIGSGALYDPPLCTGCGEHHDGACFHAATPPGRQP
jgi:hypothetical protein